MPVLTFEEFQQSRQVHSDRIAYADGVYILGAFPQGDDTNMGMRWRLPLHDGTFRSDVLPDLERRLYEYWRQQYVELTPLSEEAIRRARELLEAGSVVYGFDPAALSRYAAFEAFEAPRKRLRGMRRLKPLPLPG